MLKKHGIKPSDSAVSNIRSGGVILPNTDVPLTEYQRRMIERRKYDKEIDQGFGIRDLRKDTVKIAEPDILNNIIRQRIHDNDRSLVVQNIDMKEDLKIRIKEAQRDIKYLERNGNQLQRLPTTLSIDTYKHSMTRPREMTLMQEKQFELECLISELKVRTGSPNVLRDGVAMLQVRKEGLETEPMETRQRVSLKKTMNRIMIE